MKNWKKKLVVVFVCALMAWVLGVFASAAEGPWAPTEVTIVNGQNKSIGKKTVAKDERFELKARVNPGAEDDYLEWKIISGKNVVKFVNYEKYGDEAELKAVKTGTAKVQVFVNGSTGKTVKDTITIKVKKASASAGKITAKGGKTKHEEAGEDFDLEVKKSSSLILDSQLQWSIADKSVADFAHGGKTGREVEFYAKKAGTTKITCKYVVNGKTKSSVTFTVNVTWDD